MNVLSRFFDICRYCFSKMWNRHTLVFLFFLVLSTAFWLFQTLNEVYETEFSIPVTLRNVPEGIVVTGEPPQTLQVTLRDKGTTLLNYKYGEKLPRIVIDYARYDTGNGHISILTSELLKQILPKLAQGTQLVPGRNDTIEIFYGHGRTKRVPVRLQGHVSAGNGYYITGQRLNPDSVTVQATDRQLDTITAAYVKGIYLRDLTESQTVRVALQPVRGAKFLIPQVLLTVSIDQLVEKKVTVPIAGVNFPEGEQLRTFPSQVEITFQVGMSLYRTIKAEDFSVVVDYNTLSANTGNKCRLVIGKHPAAASTLRLSTEEVEYVIENTVR